MVMDHSHVDSMFPVLVQPKKEGKVRGSSLRETFEEASSRREG